MDRPEEARCHACRRVLGYMDAYTVVYRCACGALSQVDAEGVPYPASPRALALERELAEAEAEYRLAVQPYLLPLGLKFQTPTMVPPDNPGIIIGTWFALIVMLAGGAVLLYLATLESKLLIPGLLLALGAYPVFRLAENSRLKKVAAYRGLTESFEARRNALRAEILEMGKAGGPDGPKREPAGWF